MADDLAHFIGAVDALFIVDKLGFYKIDTSFLPMLFVALGALLVGAIFYEMFMGGVLKQGVLAGISGGLAVFIIGNPAWNNIHFLTPILIGACAYLGARCAIDLVDETFLAPLNFAETGKRVGLYGVLTLVGITFLSGVV
jgi:hypothetical protein